MSAPTQEMLDELVELYYSGLLASGHGDKRVSFDSRQELEIRIRQLASQLGVANPLAARFRVSRLSYSSGRSR